MTPEATHERLMDVFDRLLRYYGPQHWWPGETWFEVMVGAVLTQAAAWTNVERAIANLKSAGKLTPSALRDTEHEDVAALIYSSGYYNSKARKLKALADYLGERFGDDRRAMVEVDDVELRTELLGVYGIGEETADDILLYALDKPAFVVDAYTRRVFGRLGVVPRGDSYGSWRDMFGGNLPPEADLFGEYHALIVRHGKETCGKRPLCHDCPLLEICPAGVAEMG